MGIFLGLLGAIAAVVVYAISLYNRLVALKNRVKNGFSQIDVQLTRRHDLIPNLVEAVKGYMSHERGTLEDVVNARNAAVTGLKAAAADPTDPEAMKKLSGAESQLSGALGRLFALAEAYPDLKANENMMQLTEELSSTENKISFARQAYNDAVMHYNNKTEMFPSSIIAGMFNFGHAPLFEVSEDAERENVKVSFD